MSSPAWGAWEKSSIVAVDCSTHRYSEYRGPSSSPKGKLSATGVRRPADLFLRYSEFLIRELKPRMDHEYRTLPDAAHTAIMGASMGGLCSLALAWQNPETFGAAASLSGSFQVEHRQFLRRCLKLYTGLPKPIRIYLDSGVADDSGGDDGCTHTTAVADELRRIGWRDGVNLMHHVDSELLTERQLQSSGLPDHKWAEAMTSQHNEFYWRRRAGRALQFLFAAV